MTTRPKKRSNREAAPTPMPTPRTLADVIQSPDPSRFLRSTWAKRFVRLEGPRGKFAGLMPWEALNDILTDHSWSESQLQIWRNKKLLKLPTFKQRVHKLMTPELQDELNRGGTVVLNSAETRYRPLRDLTRSLDLELRAETFANLYASWKSEPSFGVHRDKQHTLILQVHGRKRWTVYPPSPTEPTRSTRPLWSGMLEDGDLLHIPKGYWHLAVSVNEPSLHLTVTVMPIDPGDLLKWIGTQVLDPSGWEQGSDLPTVGGDAEKRRWIERMRKRVARAWTDDVIDRFLADREARLTDRPLLELPSLGPPRIELDTPIRIVVPRLHIVRADAARISLRAGDCTWTMSKRALPILKALSDRRTHTLEALLARHDLHALASSLRDLFQDLAKHHVITIAEPIDR